MVPNSSLPKSHEQAVNYTGKSDKRSRYQRSGKQSDGQALEALGSVDVLQTGTDTGKQYHCQHEAQTSTQRVHHRLYEVVVLSDVQYGYTQNSTVGGDQRQIYAQCLVQSRNILLEDGFYQLYQCGDNQNEYDGLQVSQTIGLQQHIIVGQVAAVAISITKTSAALMPTAESSFLDTPRKGQIPRNLDSG